MFGGQFGPGQNRDLLVAPSDPGHSVATLGALEDDTLVACTQTYITKQVYISKMPPRHHFLVYSPALHSSDCGLVGPLCDSAAI